MFQAPRISIEFYPPKTDKGMESLRRTRQALTALNPEFYSVTYGAGGTSREGTYEIVREITEDGTVPGAPHISCITDTRESLRELLQSYQDIGVNRIVALRGDRPSGTVGRSDFNYANELVEFIRQETGDHFHIEVAAYPEMHPEARNPEIDFINFKRKVDAGASSAITQYFFNCDSYFYFRDRCQQDGINIPIVPGILPITNFAQLARFSDICGAEIPRWIRGRLEMYQDDTDTLKAFGLDVVTRLCEQLLQQGVPALHFYALNQSKLVLEVCDRLGLIPGKEQ